MAGGFGGDDEDFSQYEDDEEVEEELDEEAEESEDEEDEESFADEGDMDPIQKKIFELEEKRLQPKLKNMLEKVNTRQVPLLTPFEKRDFDKAKKHKNLKKDVTAITLALGAKKAQFSSKVMSTIAPALPVICYALLIFLAIVVIVAFVASIMPWLFPDDNLGNGSGNASSSFGVSGKDFYGVRTIYKNEEKSKTALLDEYSTIINNSVDNVLKIERTSVKDGKTYNISVTVDLTIPQTEQEGEEPTKFDYSTFNEETFKTQYSVYYALLNSIAEKVFLLDNPTTTVPTTIIEKIQGIKYFGLTSSIAEEVKILLTNKILELHNVVVFNETDNILVSDASLITQFKSETQPSIELAVTNELSKYTQRTEKLFIKDYVFETEQDMMKNIPQENYVAWIFMPKNSVQFSKISFFVTHTNFDEFSIKLFNNTNEITLKKDNSGFESEGAETFAYVADKLTLDVASYADFGTPDEQLKNGTTLSYIVNSGNLNINNYLETGEDAVLTYKVSGLHVLFESSTSFRCVEMESVWA